MTARQQQDFENRYFDQVDQGFKDIKGDIRELNNELRSNTSETRKVNSRVTKLEEKVFPAKDETIHQLPPFWRDPQVIKLFTIIALGFVVALVIFAAVKGIALPKGIF